MTYSAFGLCLRPSFDLPGLTAGAATAGLPEIAIELESPEECAAAWSGPASPSPWRGVLGDDRELTIQWGIQGDLLFGYDDRAWFRLDPTRSRLGCAPDDRQATDWLRVLLTRVLPNVSLARGREVLHASAVETPLGVVALAAPSGAGKSTLAIELVRRGWPLFADDALVLDATGPSLLAHPSAPCTSLALDGPHAGAVAGFGSEIATLGEEAWVTVERASRAPRQVAAVVLLERRPGLLLEARPLPAQPLTLAPYMLGLPDDAGRDARRFSLYSDLVGSAMLLRLRGDTGDRPEDLADMLARTLGLDPVPLRRTA